MWSQGKNCHWYTKKMWLFILYTESIHYGDGYFFNVFVIGHHSLAQLNQVETSAVETLSFACSKGGLCKECFLQEKENVQLLVLSLHSTEIQVSET